MGRLVSPCSATETTRVVLSPRQSSLRRLHSANRAVGVSTVSIQPLAMFYHLTAVQRANHRARLRPSWRAGRALPSPRSRGSGPFAGAATHSRQPHSLLCRVASSSSKKPTVLGTTRQRSQSTRARAFRLSTGPTGAFGCRASRLHRSNPLSTRQSSTSPRPAARASGLRCCMLLTAAAPQIHYL